MADFRITDLQVQTQLTEDSWVATDNTTTGYRRFNLKSVSDAASAANTAATAAMAAKTAADAAKASADAAAADAAEAATSAESRIDAAIDAIGDISELAVPLMSSDTRGGAKLGHGLKVEDGTLHLGDQIEKSTGSVLGPIISADAFGWSEQFTTTGKNLHGGYSTAATDAGVSCSIDKSGVITLSGTSTAAVYFPSRTFVYQGGYAITLSAGTYYLSTDNSTSGVHVHVVDVTNGIELKNTDGAFTLTESKQAYVRAYIESGKTVNVTIHPQLELGSTATSYEPYTGGAPSPSPDYPQEIQVAQGRNLIDPSNAMEAFADPGTHTISASSGVLSYYAKVLRDTDYVVSYTGGNRLRIAGTGSTVPSNGVSCTMIYDNSFSSEPYKAFNSGNNNYIVVYVSNNTTTAPVSNIQLELGSTPSPYISYGFMGLDVQGKNLFDKGNDLKYFNSSGVLESSSASSSTSYIKASSGDAFSLSSSASSSGLVIAFFNANKVLLGRYTSSGTNPLQNMIAPENTAYVLGSNYNGATQDTMFVKEQVASAYEPYWCSTTLISPPPSGYAASLPDGTADELTIDAAGHLVWTQRVGKVVLDGSESWTMFNNGKQVRTLIADAFASSSGSVKTPSLCDTFIADTGDNVWHGESASFSLGAATNGDVFFAAADGTGSMTVSAWKTWLSTHNVTLLYPLATPITHDLGYISLPEIPGAATVSIKELDDLSVRYCLDGLLDESQRAQERKLDVRMTNIENTMHRLTEPSNSVVSGPLASAEAKGWAEQDTTSGKNLAMPNVTTGGLLNGITWTYLGKNVWKADGTPSDTSAPDFKAFSCGVLPAGTYTLSARILSGSGTPSIRVGVGSNATIVSQYRITGTSGEVTFVANGSDTYYVTPKVDLGYTMNNIVLCIQVEAGSTATAYEPYTGGAPSPSPSYPQEIRVGKGRNLATVTQFTATANGGIDQPPNGTNTGLYVESGKTYTLSLKKASSGTINYYYLSDFSGIGTMSGSTSVMTFTATKTGYIYPYASSGQFTASSVVATEVQLELGFVPSPYVPYGYVGLKAQGKNLLDESAVQIGMSHSNANVYRAIFVVPVQEEATYTFSSATPPYELALFWRDGSGNVITYGNIQTPETFTIPSGITNCIVLLNKLKTYNHVDVSNPSSFTQSDLNGMWFQLEIGSTATAYEPYFHPTVPIPLPSTGCAAALPDGTADELTIDPAGKVQWVQRVARMVADGVSNLPRAVNTDGSGTSAQCELVLKENGVNRTPNKSSNWICLCNRFVNRDSWTQHDQLKNYNGCTYLIRSVNADSGTTVASWTTWLQSHPVEYYWVLKDPIIHDMGYVDLPDISSECQVSIPELADFGCTAWVDDDGTIHALAQAFYDRAHSEYESRLTALESAVAQLAIS